MLRFFKLTGLLISGLACFCSLASADRTPLSEKELTRGSYLLEQGNTDEALRHLKNIPLSYPKSSEAPISLRILAEIYLDRGQYDQAKTAIDRVVSEYTEHENAEYHTLLNHYISMFTGDVRDAINRRVQIEAIVSKTPSSQTATLARAIMVKLAIADRDLPRAELLLTQLLLRIRSGVVYRCALGDLAVLRLLQDNPVEAMLAIQQIRESTEDEMIRDRAAKDLDRLNRIYLDPSSTLIRTADFEFAEHGSKGPVDININSNGKLTVLDRNPIQITFDTIKSGAGVSKSVPEKSTRLNLGYDEALLIIAGNHIVSDESILFSSASHPIRNLVDAIWTTPGEYWLLDRSADTFFRFDRSRQALGPGPKLNLSGKEHLVRNPIGGTWLVLPSSDAVYLVNTRGTDIQEINLQIPDTKKVEPVDIASDSLGHLYVLDRNQHLVVVYSPSFKRIKSFTVESQEFRLRSPVALAVDPQGRFYIADQKFKVIYQFK